MSTPVDQALSTYFVIYDSGSVARFQMGGETPPELSEPGRVVTEEEYTAAQEAIRSQVGAARAAAEATDQAERKAAYDALNALPGITEDVARRISGYQPPDGAPSDTGGSTGTDS
jgi:hypothetical protein